MKNITKYTAKAVATVLSLAMVISAFTGVFSAFAAEAGVSVKDTYKGIDTKTSAVKESAAKVEFFDGKEFKNIDVVSASKLTDNDFDTVFECDYENAPFYDIFGDDVTVKDTAVIANKYLDGSARYLQVTLPLDGKTNVSDILVVNHANADFATYYYEIFAADSEDNLYNKANSVYTYTNVAKEKVQDFNFANGISGVQFVGIRVYNPVSNWDDSYVTKYGANVFYTRLGEFNVYGSVQKNNGKFDAVTGAAIKEDNELKVPDLGKVAVKEVSGGFYNGGVNTWNVTEKEIGAITDGKADTFAEFSECVFMDKDKTAFVDGSRYLDLTYKVKKDFVVKKMLLVNSETAAFRTSVYEIYASDDADKLYSEANRVLTYTNAKNKARQIITFNNGDGLDAKYIGVRVLNPVKNVKDFNYDASFCVARIAELNFFGGAADGNTFDADVSPLKLELDKNKACEVDADSAVDSMLTYYKAPEATDKAITDVVSEDATVTAFDALKSGKATVSARGSSFATGIAGQQISKIYTDGTAFFDIIYTLKGKTDISDIVVSGVKEDAYKLSYILFAADDMDKLFNEDSIVYKYNNEGLKQTQHYTADGLTATYVALRITACTTTENASDFAVTDDFSAIYPRLSMFNVYGTVKTEKAEETEKGEADVIANEKAVLSDGNNILLGATATVTTVDEKSGVSQDITENVEAVNDGKVDDLFFVGADNKAPFVKWDKNNDKPVVTTDGTVHTDFVFNVNGNATIDSFDIVHHGNPALRTAHFMVFAANSEKDLFNEKNMVADVDNSDAAISNTIKLSAPITGVQFVGVRVIDPCSDYDDVACKLSEEDIKNKTFEVYPRIAEIAAYGSVVFGPEPQKVINSETNALPGSVNLKGYKNLSDPITPVANYSDSVAEIEKAKVDIQKPGNLADANFSTSVAFKGAMFAEYDSIDDVKCYYNTDGSMYLDILYNFKNPANLKYAVIGNAGGKLNTGLYDVFVSDKEGTLFNSENLYVTVDNATAYAGGKDYKVNVIDFNGLQGQVVGIRVHNPVSGVAGSDMDLTVSAVLNNFYTRLNEFAVYGNYVDPEFSPVLDLGDAIDTAGLEITKDLMLGYGENLLAGITPTFQTDGQNFSATSSSLTKFLDMVANTFFPHIDFSMGNDSLTVKDIIFKLRRWDLHQINGFALQEMGRDNPPYYIGHYQVYVSKTLDELFDSASMVYEYDSSTVPTPMKGQIFTFDEGKQPVGNYFAFRIIKSNHSSTSSHYDRFGLMWAWGEEAVLAAQPSNLAENMPLEAYYSYKNKATRVSDSELTTKETAALSDSNTGTSATISTNTASKKKVEFLYNLCNDMKVDKISLSTVNNATTGFSVLEVYAGDTIAEVNNEAWKIWEYNTVGTGTITPAKTFATQAKMRYVRFVFSGCKNNITINDINVIGLDDQKMKTKIFSTGIQYSDIEITTMNKKTRNNVDLGIQETTIANMVDAEPATVTDVYTESIGYVGENNINSLIFLGDLKTISHINLSFLKHFETYWPSKINLYIGEYIEQIEDKNAKPNYVITTKDIKNAEWNVDIRPIMARYILIECVDFPKNDLYKMPDGKQRICTLLPDLILTGTSVVGMQTSDEDDNLITLKDEKYPDIDVNIVRLDTNDVYSGVYSVKINEVTPYNKQMNSLNKSPYLKVHNKKAYEINFYDFYGNKVDYIGNREVKIMFKTPEGRAENSVLVGDCNDRNLIETCETYQTATQTYARISYYDAKNNKFCLLLMTTADDPYFASIGPDEVWDDEKDDKDDDDNNDIKVHNEEWYKSIRTTDKKFVVTPSGFEFKNKTKFVAKDIAATASDQQYMDILELVGGKKIAAFFDMSLTKNSKAVDVSAGAVDVSMKLPSYVTNNFDNVQVVYVDSTGQIQLAWSEQSGKKLDFQFSGTENIGTVALIGDAKDGTTSYDKTSNSYSPSTGESVTIVFAVLALMAGAAFVLIRSRKKSANQ